MSRVGKKPIPIPEKVTVQVKDSVVEVKGPLGTLRKPVPAELSVRVENKEVHVEVKDAASLAAPLLHGLTRTLIANHVQGVVEPWKKDLEIHGVGYRASKNGQTLNLSLGFSHPIDYKVPETVLFNVDAKQTLVSMS